MTGLARLAPRHIAEWHFRHVLTATYWSLRALVWWFADQAMAMLLPPDERVCYLVVDSTLKSKRGAKDPVAQKWRLNENGPYLLGLHLVLVLLQWGNCRIPIDFEIVPRKEHPRAYLQSPTITRSRL